MTMKLKIVFIITAMSLLCNEQAKAKGFWEKLGNFVGNVVETAVVVSVDHAMEKYAPEQAARYKQTVQELNERSQKRAEEDAAAWKSYQDGRKAELQKELLRASDSGVRESIRQEMGDLDAVSSYSASSHDTSLSSSILSAVGMNQQNIQRGMAWNDAQSKYEKQNVAKDYVFDALGEISDNAELFEKFRQISEVQNVYLSENSKTMTAEEKQVALAKRNRAYFDIGYDTYQEVKDRRSKHLAEKLQISQKLKESGWYLDSQLAEEVAGSIIAIQKSDLSAQEKETLLYAYGLGEANQVMLAVEEVLADNANDAEAARIRAEEKAKHQAELRKQEEERKAAEERKIAIEKIPTIKIDSYTFDETTLSKAQESAFDGIAETLNKYSDVKILLIGHTCNIGYKSINQKKGLKRAEIAKAYLVEKGVSQNRISVDSKGELQPLDKNNSEENRKINRRIEVFIDK